MKPRRRWFRFGLRRFFIVLTLFGVWLGYQVNWIRQRQQGREWLLAHGVGGAIGYIAEPRPNLPWSLRVLGEESFYKSIPIGAFDEEERNLSAYRRRVAEMTGLFPETHIMDTESLND